MQSSSQIVTTNKPTPVFYGPDALPVSNSVETLKGKYIVTLCRVIVWDSGRWILGSYFPSHFYDTVYSL